MPLPNSEKQARFRRKAELERKGAAVLEAWRAASEDPQYVAGMAARIKELTELPTGWSDEDYQWATRELDQLRFLALAPPGDELAIEILEKHYLDLDIPKDSHPDVFEEARRRRDLILESTRQLRQHLVSAIRLVKDTPADTSIAVLAVARDVGADLLSARNIPTSTSNAVCLASLPVEFDRPPWVVNGLATWLADRLTDEDRLALARLLTAGK